MRVALTGATGLVGQFIAATSCARPRPRRPRPRALPHGGEAPPLAPGRPRPPRGLRRPGPLRLRPRPRPLPGRRGRRPRGLPRRQPRRHAAALGGRAGPAAVFLSSRAVYDGLPPGTVLTEDLPLAPDSLYGRAKLAAEEALHAQGGASPPRHRRLRPPRAGPAPQMGRPLRRLRARRARRPRARDRGPRRRPGARPWRSSSAPRPAPTTAPTSSSTAATCWRAGREAHGVDGPAAAAVGRAPNVMDCAAPARAGLDPRRRGRAREALRAM